MKMKQLQEKRGELVKKGREILDKAQEESRALTPEETESLSKIQDEADGLAKSIYAEVRQMALESQKGITLTKSEERDVSRFDIGRVLRHMDRVMRGQHSVIDGIEGEMIEQGEIEAKQSGIENRGIVLPEMLVRRERRDLSVTGGTSTQYGGELVATEKQGLLGDFYNRSVLAQSGALVLTGLQGNVDLPRYAQASDPTKKGENAASDELSPTFASLSLSPKRLPATIDISDQLLNQTTALEAFLQREIVAQMLGVQEVAFFHGGGTNEPTGIAGTSGIGSVAGGTNGLAPTWTHIVELEAAVEDNNALMGNLQYYTNSAVKKKLRTTAKVSSTDSVMIWDAMLKEGTTPQISNAVSRTLSKGSSSGVCSAIFFGNAEDFVIGYWGGIMLEMVRDSAGAKAGLRSLVANTYYDAGVLRPKSWAAMLDALTA